MISPAGCTSGACGVAAKASWACGWVEIRDAVHNTVRWACWNGDRLASASASPAFAADSAAESLCDALRRAAAYGTGNAGRSLRALRRPRIATLQGRMQLAVALAVQRCHPTPGGRTGIRCGGGPKVSRRRASLVAGPISYLLSHTRICNSSAPSPVRPVHPANMGRAGDSHICLPRRGS
jgi:hypothetical protein